MSASILKYNELVQRQQALTATIQEAVGTIVTTLAVKERTAEEQKTIQVSEIGVPYPQHSVADVRRHVVDVIVRRLEQRDTTGTTDWSCRLAQPGGNLEE